MIVSKKIWVTAALVLGMSVADVVASTWEEGNWVAVCDNVGSSFANDLKSPNVCSSQMR